MQAYFWLNKASKESFPTLKIIFSTEIKLHGAPLFWVS